MAEVMSVLFFHTMRYKVSVPRDPNSDRFILSKGHAAPILYAGNYRDFFNINNSWMTNDSLSIIIYSMGRSWIIPC